jgi:SAM-dependent methyltransferase
MHADCSSLWPQINETVGPCIRPGGLSLTRRALDICRLPAGSRVADIGCGAGATLEHLDSAGMWPVGLDCSAALLADAALRSATGRLAEGRAAYLPFRDGAFDALFCECTLSILDDRAAALEEYARVLKEGAFLIISDVFARNTGAEDEAQPDTLPVQGFLARSGLVGHLAALGFSVLVWEEHDRLLKEFAARMVLAGQCLPDVWRGRPQGRQNGANGRRGISYFLLVARKQCTLTGAGA